MIFFDTETCGFHGPIVLIQYAQDDGDIYLHSPWISSIKDTLEIMDEIIEEPDGICGFNLTFDWFHICQQYLTLKLLAEKVGYNAKPVDHVDLYAKCEKEARDGYCIKPNTAIDLMLHARKGVYQNTMDRDDIRIKRVPSALSYVLAQELNRRIVFPDIYFAKQKTPQRWHEVDILDDFGDPIPDFKDVKIGFAPSSALKALAVDALKIPRSEILTMDDVQLPKAARPVESGFAPFALAPFIKNGKVLYPGPNEWYGKWPDVIHHHISHWGYNPLARKYAKADVDYTRRLYHFFGSPRSGDDDSILACMVGASRWRGFAIDEDKLQSLRATAQKSLDAVLNKFNFQSNEVCRKYLEQVLDETERLVMHVGETITTKAVILEEISKWKLSVVCGTCMGSVEDLVNGGDCQDCNDGLVETDEPHLAAVRAMEILDARHAKKEIELYDKLLFAGRLHASLNIIGARSSRMSGADGLNAQGIRRAKETRAAFPLAYSGDRLCGGDFDAFEVGLCDAVYGDPVLAEDLDELRECSKCKGAGCEECKDTGSVPTKIHGLIGSYFFDKSYDEILESAGLPGEQDLYTRSKNGFFALIYMGEAYTLHTRVGLPIEKAEEGYNRFINRYRVFGEKRMKYMRMFCSMRQPKGIGTNVEWHDPEEYIESMFGFRRYFTLENKICKALYDLALAPPKEWSNIKIRVMRRDRMQSASGAMRSSLYAAAFAVQAANMRAAGNHVIQSSGAQITKFLQRRIWDVQPSGIHHWRVQPFNSHDEIMNPTHPDHTKEVEGIVSKFIEEYRVHVPRIGMTWKTGMESWADK